MTSADEGGGIAVSLTTRVVWPLAGKKTLKVVLCQPLVTSIQPLCLTMP